MVQITNADINDDLNDDAEADSQSIMIHILTKWSSAQVIVEQPDKYQRKEKNNFYYNTEIYHVIHTSYLSSFFSLAHFKAWKFYIQKCVNLRQ